MFRYYYCYWWTDWPNTQLYTELTSELIGRETSAEESGHFQEVLSVFPMKMKTLWVSKFINEALLLLWNQYFLDLGQFYPKARWKCICVIRYSSLKSLSFSASIEQSCSVIFFFQLALWFVFKTFWGFRPLVIQLPEWLEQMCSASRNILMQPGHWFTP